MTDEKKQESGGKETSGKRRYFRRRNKNKKSKSGEQSTSGAVTKAKKSGSAPTGERKGAPTKKRRSRRRRSPRRSNQQDMTPEVIQEPDHPYEEPISVYVYTHVVRPAYRDTISEYRPDSLFQHRDNSGAVRSGMLEVLTKEIQEQLDRQFASESDKPSAPNKIYESIEIDEFDEDEDFDDNLDQFEEDFEEK